MSQLTEFERDKKAEKDAFDEKRDLYIKAKFAPGYYYCRCVDCNHTFMGDKRAVRCFDCASRVIAEHEAETELERLRKLVYVPGLWRCPKCEFTLVQANLNAHDGSVTARDQPGDKCPNCNSPLWRVTERDAGNDMAKRCEAAAIENRIFRNALEKITEPFILAVGDKTMDPEFIAREFSLRQQIARRAIVEADTIPGDDK